MIIGNRTSAPRAVHFGNQYITIPAMGYTTLEDTAYNREVLNRLKRTETFKRLLDADILVLNEKVTEESRETKVQGPTPPAELTQEPPTPRVKRGKPKKTKETMKV